MKVVRKDAPAPARVAPSSVWARVRDRFRALIRDTRTELRKVVWPTREQAARLTGVVIAVSVVVGLVMGGLDLVFKWLFELILGVAGR